MRRSISLNGAQPRGYNAPMTETNEKLRTLECFLKGARRVAIAFSGGTDSTFLAAFAHALPGVQATAITVRSSFIPDADLAFAEAFCAERAIPHVILDVDPLACEEVRANPPERCYHCKRLIMSAIVEAACERGALACDGSNADDAHDFRPGAQAVRELGIASPLADAGLTKVEVRAAAQAVGLPNWDTPASACLASRIPYGVPLEASVLARIAQAEAALRAEGFAQARVRAHGDVARIEVPAVEAGRLFTHPLRQRLAAAVHDAGFAYVAVDLDGYRMGSLNEELQEAAHD